MMLSANTFSNGAKFVRKCMKQATESVSSYHENQPDHLCQHKTLYSGMISPLVPIITWSLKEWDVLVTHCCVMGPCSSGSWGNVVVLVPLSQPANPNWSHRSSIRFEVWTAGPCSGGSLWENPFCGDRCWHLGGQGPISQSGDNGPSLAVEPHFNTSLQTMQRLAKGVLGV